MPRDIFERYPLNEPVNFSSIQQNQQAHLSPSLLLLIKTTHADMKISLSTLLMQDTNLILDIAMPFAFSRHPQVINSYSSESVHGSFVVHRAPSSASGCLHKCGHMRVSFSRFALILFTVR